MQSLISGFCSKLVHAYLLYLRYLYRAKDCKRGPKVCSAPQEFSVGIILIFLLICLPRREDVEDPHEGIRKTNKTKIYLQTCAKVKWMESWLGVQRACMNGAVSGQQYYTNFMIHQHLDAFVRIHIMHSTINFFNHFQSRLGIYNDIIVNIFYPLSP